MSSPLPLRRLLLCAVFAAAGVAAALHPPAASAAGATFNVNPVTGNDADPGTAAKPLKTLTTALAKAQAGDTIQLAGGNYSTAANGERFSTINGAQPVAVPSGVTIRGNAGKGLATSLFGAANEIGLLLRGNATVSEIDMFGFGVGLQASQGKQTLDGLEFNRGGGIRLTGSADTTLTGAVQLSLPFFVARGQTIFRHPTGAAVSVNDTARFTMTGGDLFGEKPNGGGQANCDTTQKGIFASGSARVTLRSVLIQDLAGGALDLTGASAGTLDGSNIVAEYDSDTCIPLPSARTLGTASLTVRGGSLVSNGKGAIAHTHGIRALGSGGVSVTNSKILGYDGTGIVAGPSATSLAVAGTELSNRTDIDARAATHAAITVTDSKLIVGVTGIIAPSLRLRRTELTRNHTGIVITGPHADLGTAADPGLNVITGTGVNTGVAFDPSVTAGTIDAFGNVWTPSEQGADAFGFYPKKTVFGGFQPGVSLGRNFRVPSAFQSINLGPIVGRLRLAPRVVHARAGRPVRLRLAWTHPVAWRQLRSVELRLSRGGRVVVRPAAGTVRARGAVRVIRGATRLRHRGKTVTATLALRFPRSYAGRRLRVDVVATDRHGRRQNEPAAGRVVL
jgi:uncharacterized protein DUF1565